MSTIDDEIAELLKEAVELNDVLRGSYQKTLMGFANILFKYVRCIDNYDNWYKGNVPKYLEVCASVLSVLIKLQYVDRKPSMFEVCENFNLLSRTLEEMKAIRKRMEKKSDVILQYTLIEGYFGMYIPRVERLIDSEIKDSNLHDVHVKLKSLGITIPDYGTPLKVESSDLLSTTDEQQRKPYERLYDKVARGLTAEDYIKEYERKSRTTSCSTCRSVSLPGNDFAIMDCCPNLMCTKCAEYVYVESRLK